jgi:RNA polymerase sigma-70 factor (ECF subfamily)
MSANDSETTFKEWVDEHLGLILRVVRAYGRTADDQDDLFQEILLQIWLSIPRFGGRAKVSTWLYKVAFNTALVWNRSEKTRRKHSDRLVTLAPQTQTNDSQQSQEIIGRLYEAIRKLQKVDASIVLMHLDGLAYSEMAEILGISESNVGVKLNRAKKQLASGLKGLIDDI